MMAHDDRNGQSPSTPGRSPGPVAPDTPDPRDINAPAQVGIRSYLKGLSRPATWNDLADFLGKTVFALAAVAIATVAGCYSQAKLAAEKEQAVQDLRKANEQKELLEGLSNRREEISLFLNYMPSDRSDPQLNLKLSVLASYCSGDARLRISDVVGRELCKRVNEFGVGLAADSRNTAVSAAAAAVRTRDPDSYLRSPVAASQRIALTAAEAGGPNPTGRWYAVVASVPLSTPGEDVRRLAQEMNERLKRSGLPAQDVHIYRTSISRSYALTSGRAKSEAEAKARVRMLRETGQVRDAFAQADRQWAPADELR